MDFQTLEGMVQHDAKSRYHLLFEPGGVGSEENVWWIRANQGHTIKVIISSSLNCLAHVLAGGRHRDE